MKNQLKSLEDYLKGHKASGLKVGDKVKVLREFEDFEGGCGVDWGNTMKYFIGNTYKIKEDSEKNGFCLWNGNETDFFYFPYFVLEKVEESAKKEVKNYEDVLEVLEPKWQICIDGSVNERNRSFNNHYPTKEKAEQFYAKTQLDNVATYLNEIKFKDVEWSKHNQYYINSDEYKININPIAVTFYDGTIRFKSKEAAKRAIDILGEETIKMALK